MKKYLTIAKATWQEYFAYRLNFLLEVLGGIVTMLVIVALWSIIFKQSDVKVIGGFSFPQMITYLLGAGLINSFLWHYGQGDEINDDINWGRLSNLLLKPLRVPFYWLTRDICRRILTLFLGLGQFIIILFLFRNFLLGPPSLIHLIFTLLAVFLGGLLHFLIFYLFSIIAFWMDQTWGTRFVIRVIMEIAAGALIPLSLFPTLWRVIFNILPFKYMIYFPLEIYLGKIAPTQMYQEFLIVSIWLGVLTGICLWVWKKGLRYYSAVGG